MTGPGSGIAHSSVVMVRSKVYQLTDMLPRMLKIFLEGGDPRSKRKRPKSPANTLFENLN